MITNEFTGLCLEVSALYQTHTSHPCSHKLSKLSTIPNEEMPCHCPPNGLKPCKCNMTRHLRLHTSNFNKRSNLSRYEGGGEAEIPHSVAVELVLELLLALLGTAADGIDPGLVEPVPGAEADVDFESDVAVELHVFSPLDLVVRHPQRLKLHRLHPAPIRDEDEAREAGPPRVLRGVGLHVQLLRGEGRRGGLLPAPQAVCDRRRRRGGDLALDFHEAGGDRRQLGFGAKP